MEVEAPFLSTTAGESAFFRALCDARPVGMHREFHMMAVAAYIQAATGNTVSVDELWEKFKSCYDQNILEGYEKPGYRSTGSTSSSSSDDEDAMDLDAQPTPKARRKSKDPPKPGEDLEHHPFFRKEFELPVGPGWPPLASTSGRRDSGATAATATTAHAGHGHTRKESTATGRTTRASAKTVEKAASESDSDLTTDEGGEGADDTEGEADAEGEDVEDVEEDAEGDEEKDGKGARSGRETKSVGDPEEQSGATRRSTRTRTATKEAPSVKGAAKKKRGK